MKNLKKDDTFVSSKASAMNDRHQVNYERIAKAIHYIKSNFKEQPNLDEVAKYVHLSPFHFQRLFHEWAGTTPKKFLQYVSLDHARSLLKDQQASLFDAAYDTGLSGTGRLHDLFIHIEGMTPAEYKNGGMNLEINYVFGESPFGSVLAASTSKGLCHLVFFENEASAIHELKSKFPNAAFRHKMDQTHQNALSIFQKDWHKLSEIKLHLKGTDFQLKIWEALLKIPSGSCSTYGRIAAQIGNPKASRAVGTAIGSNPIAYLIPCHRVIQANGNIGGYMWGNTRKTAILGWESAKNEPQAE